jgi:hypothetical protein
MFSGSETTNDYAGEGQQKISTVPLFVTRHLYFAKWKLILRESLKIAKKQADNKKEHKRTKRCCLWYRDRSAKLQSFHAYGFSRFVCLVTVSTEIGRASCRERV